LITFPVLKEPTDTTEVRKALIQLQEIIDSIQVQQTNITNITTQVPTGSVQMFAGTTEPTGWLWCRGLAVSRTTYAALFAVIGTTYGTGDGTTTFKLPDVQNITPYGANSSTRTISSVVHPATPLGTTHNDRIQDHDHFARDLLNFSGGENGHGQNGTVAGNTTTRGISSASVRRGVTTMAAGLGINFIIKI
jgi:microcystin-dependent protein